MTKTLRKPVTMLLALCMVFTLAVGACADDITFSGGSATSPVNLTTTNEGIGGGDGGEGTTTPTRMSVTVPTALPMAMSDDGTVVTASDCKITNNSYGAVRVRSVSISAAAGWNLTAFGDKSSLAGEKVDSNKLGFAMSIGGGAQAALAEAGIQLFGGVTGAADEAVADYLAGKLNYVPGIRCDHHDHGHDHDCGSHGCGGGSCHH